MAGPRDMGPDNKQAPVVVTRAFIVERVTGIEPAL
ncbi:hypothetical protein SXANM310S_06996 [Streptomyces xanthochromogenes]